MPWQAQIFVGKRVHNLDDLYKIAKDLGLDFPKIKAGDDDEIYASDHFPKKEVTFEYKGIEYTETISFQMEYEGGCGWPVPDDEDYTDALVGFEITSRYAPGVLNQKGSRPEPFELDLEGIIHIRDQIRKVWPSVEVYIWDIFY